MKTRRFSFEDLENQDVAVCSQRRSQMWDAHPGKQRFPGTSDAAYHGAVNEHPDQEEGEGLEE